MGAYDLLMIPIQRVWYKEFVSHAIKSKKQHYKSSIVCHSYGALIWKWQWVSNNPKHSCVTFILEGKTNYHNIYNSKESRE